MSLSFSERMVVSSGVVGYLYGYAPGSAIPWSSGAEPATTIPLTGAVLSMSGTVVRWRGRNDVQHLHFLLHCASIEFASCVSLLSSCAAASGQVGKWLL